MPGSRELLLSYSYWPLGRWGNGWRHPGSHNLGSVDADYLRSQVELCEEAGFDYFFLGDISTTNAALAAVNPTHAFKLEGFALAGYVAALSKKIGIITTVNSSVEDPYSVARRALSLDHLSAGRIGLNLVTGAEATASALRANHSGGGALAPGDKYARAAEFIQIIHGLTDSWEDGWFLDDRAAGRFLDPAKAHALNHRGSHFNVVGPLNLPRSVQGHLPVVHAGTSEASLNFGARYADIRFALAQDLPWNKRFYADVKARGAVAGFAESDRLVVPGFQFFIAETDGEAHSLFRDIQARRAIPFSAAGIEAYFGVKLERAEPEARVHDVLDVAALPKRWIIENAIDSYADDGITLLDLHDFITNNPVNQPPVVGGPVEVADWIEEWFTDRALDGVKVFPPYGGDYLRQFVRLILPELSRRGLFDGRRKGATLREILGLSPAAAFETREAVNG